MEKVYDYWGLKLQRNFFVLVYALTQPHKIKLSRKSMSSLTTYFSPSDKLVEYSTACKFKLSSAAFNVFNAVSDILD